MILAVHETEYAASKEHHASHSFGSLVPPISILQRKVGFILMILTIVTSFANCAISMTPISTTTATGAQTAGNVWYGLSSFGYATGLNVTAVGDNSHFTIKLFNNLGNLLASTSVANTTTQILMFDPLRMFSVETQNVRQQILQVVGATYSMNLDYLMTLVAYYYLAQDIAPGTTLVYASFYQSYNVMTVYDHSSHAIINSVTVNPSNNCEHLYVFNSSFLLTSSDLPTIYIFDRTSLALLHSFVATSADTGAMDCVFNNLNYSQLIGINTITAASPNQIWVSAYDISNFATSTDPVKAYPSLQLPGPTLSANPIYNLGIYAYAFTIPFFEPTGSNLYLVTKPYLDSVQLLPLVNLNVGWSSLANAITLDVFTQSFSYLAGPNVNVQIYNIIFDGCIYRDSTGLCHSCVAGYYVLSNACTICNSNCLTCFGIATNCTSCTAPLLISSTNFTCSPCGTGYYSAGGYCYPCDPSCITCSGSSTSCIISSSTPLYFNASKPLVLAAGTDLGFTLSLQSVGVQGGQGALASLLPEVEKLMPNSVSSIKITSLSSGQLLNDSVLKVELTVISLDAGLLSLAVGLVSNPPIADACTVCYSSTAFKVFAVNGTSYTLQPFNFCQGYQSPESYSSFSQLLQSSAFQVAEASNTNSKSEAGNQLIGLIAAADPTGILSKFTQNLKIFIRLYFLNIKVGGLYDGFLEKFCTSVPMLVTSISKEYQLESLQGYRGRLTNKKISMNFTTSLELMVKVGLYLGMWTLKIISSIILLFRFKVGKAGLFLMFFLPKFHLISFTLILSDFLFFGTHCLLHQRNLLNQLFAFAVINLICLDLVGLLSLSFDHFSWSLFIKMRQPFDETKLKKTSTIFQRAKSKVNEIILEKPEEKNLSSRKYNEPSNHVPRNLSQSQAANSKEEKLRRAQEKYGNGEGTRAVDYENTFANIAANLFAVFFMKGFLNIKKSTLSHTGSKIYFHLHIYRTIIFQVLFVACQYTPVLALLSFLVIETSKVAVGVYNQVKYRIFMSWIIWILESLSSLFLIVLLLLVYFPSMLNCRISENLQLTGLGIILSLLLFEYLILASSLIFEVISAIKNRKKKMAPKYESIMWFAEEMKVGHVTQRVDINFINSKENLISGKAPPNLYHQVHSTTTSRFRLLQSKMDKRTEEGSEARKSQVQRLMRKVAAVQTNLKFKLQKMQTKH